MNEIISALVIKSIQLSSMGINMSSSKGTVRAALCMQRVVHARVVSETYVVYV